MSYVEVVVRGDLPLVEPLHGDRSSRSLVSHLRRQDARLLGGGSLVQPISIYFTSPRQEKASLP